MTKDYKEVLGMCTYADAIERKGILKGIEKGREEGIEEETVLYPRSEPWAT